MVISLIFFFFFNDTATTEIYTLSLHDALPIFRYTPSPPAVNPFAYFHTNGLASGNVMEEAVCHALCEVIERDAMSLADLRASAIPFHILRTEIGRASCRERV